MEQIPIPVDINKLKSILGNAKKLMNATDQKFGSKSGDNKDSRVNEDYSQAPIYDSRDEREPEYQVSAESTLHKPMVYSEQAVLNSRLPDNIKKIMLSTPIPKYSGQPTSFSLEDMGDLVDKPKNKFKSPGVPIHESSGTYQAPTINITVELLNEMIDNRVNAILAKMYTKTISEQAIKKTISTLISEGKLSVKKK